MRLSGREVRGDVVRARSPKDDNVEEGVGSESVRSVDGNARGFSGGVESGDDGFLSGLKIQNARRLVSFRARMR